MESLIAGACAGLFVDLSLYPIDTVKTRIQSKEGFLASGGFKHVYKGLSAVAVGSVPGGAAFFFAYDTAKRVLLSSTLSSTVAADTAATGPSRLTPRVVTCQAAAAMCGETFACCIRVPVEMVKQQMQAGHHGDIMSALRYITNNVPPPAAAAVGQVPPPPPIRLSGVYHLFHGMPIMLMRELPFSVIQMSLYETLKSKVYAYKDHPYAALALPLCGAFSGGCAAFFTTPLDVVKTRIMLLRHHSPTGGGKIRFVLDDLMREPARPGDRFGYVQRFFRGASTRVLWISLGGSIFFGTYEFVKAGFRQIEQA
ncbi:putative mitochondrial mitochondrial carrier protein [Leptomonas pyrrhocoris]|uniref:Putative mitochondrial mitochondrial carrier protein n=1 Tax=Leptomonas pyrrhocoris TaxID=157538 RepID=A0A0M9G7U8_LEPPY|nr:putative mitochondrial mitochondrial carrier protein [Leptomonas pyrrhocoris]KPA84490.1 putative mitochondrial mitochondrial carrier protein [Leptomonas pyrrhocoris]|eukprot:XP_015662929.1 putative mitochondrial mitochondrial carrier protein [Leptomonas pyrrhocoris]